MYEAITIPQELVNEIIYINASGLRRDTQTLSACSLVARDWMYTCRKYMFRHIGISKVSETGTRVLIESLLTSPHETICRSIESVSLEVYPEGNITTRFISTLGAKGVHPSKLTVTFLNDTNGSLVDQLGLEALVSQWAGRVTALHLKWTDIRRETGESALGAFLSTFKSISALILHLPGNCSAGSIVFSPTDELSRELSSMTLGAHTNVDDAIVSWTLAQPLKLTRLSLTHHNEHIRLISGYGPVLTHLDIIVGGGRPPINQAYPPLPVLTRLVLRLHFSELPRATTILQSIRDDLASISRLELQILSMNFPQEASIGWVKLRPIIEALPTLNTVHFHLREVWSRHTMQTQRAILQEVFETSAQREVLIISHMMSRPIPVFETV